MRKHKDRIKRQQQRQNFEFDPALCKNCKHRKRVFMPHKDSSKLQQYCTLGKFSVQVHSICDRWESTRGETLELPP